MSDNPRLNPIIVVVPLISAYAAGAAFTLPFLRSDLGGQVLDKSPFFYNGAAITASDTVYSAMGVKVGAQAVGLAATFQTAASGGTGNVAANTPAPMKSGGTAPAQVALRQWPRGTSTDIAVTKVDTGGGLAAGTAAGAYFSLPIMQSAYDPLS